MRYDAANDLLYLYLLKCEVNYSHIRPINGLIKVVNYDSVTLEIRTALLQLEFYEKK
jgi:hypothetical protein